ncbi:MAG: Cys-tRNA(Pro) deacylase [Leucobacter sp.]|nr:Cys-tRNA(Pro) deacylase [Leucobacter sp.]
MAKKKSAGQTPATAQLVKLGIAFDVREYQHDPTVTEFGAEAVTALGVSADQVFKTLLVEADGSLVVGIVPVAGLLDLKALAGAIGARKAVMADPKLAERKTGYVVGGISPLGQRTVLPTVLDATALQFTTVLVSGGRRGLDLELAPAELVRATNAVIADIARVR